MFWCLLLMACTACAPSAAAIPPGSITLIPYTTGTPSATADPLGGSGDAPAAVLPSSTPFTYTIRAGDTLGGIAEKFGVDLDALRLANPDVDPNSMTVGKTLLIPAASKNAGGDAKPTPEPVLVQQTGCLPAADGGLWCYALVHNDSLDRLQDVTGQIALVDQSGKVAASQAAMLPLDILPAGSSLPLSAFFAPGVPAGLQPQVQILTGIRLLRSDKRYLDAAVQGAQVQVDWSGLSGQASGQVVLAAGSKPARSTWVAAVVYNEAGMVTGVRRWESDAVLQPDASLPFSFQVSSLAGHIARVDFAVEARP